MNLIEKHKIKGIRFTDDNGLVLGIADLVVSNPEGDWLALTDQEDWFYANDNGEYIAAPENWRELVIDQA